MRVVAKPFPEILSSSEDQILNRLEKLADLLDSRWRIPKTQIRIGLDPLLGLVPVLGDAISAIIGLYIVVELSDLGLPLWTRLRMLTNVVLDFVLGCTPVLGDALDVFYRSNVWNVAIARKALAKQAARRARRARKRRR